MTADWEKAASDKRESVLKLIPSQWVIPKPPSVQEQRDVTGSFVHQYLDKKEIEITETDAVGIVKNTSSGTWTSVEVTEAFCHRAAIAHQLVNCLHEIFFDAAIASAKELDEYYTKHQKPIGPLHGLPVSLKDQFHVKGVDTHMGYVGWIGTFRGKKGTGKDKVYESVMVEELRESGAVLYVKTSVPHTLMCGETVNNIVGYTWNPHNRNLSSGGSSGGEGALIALKGSPVGFGTDIGGSIRIPAGFNGLYGLRPSIGRLPYEGMANSFDGAPGVLSVVGPLSPTVGGLKLVVQSLLAKSPWLHDPLVHELPWRSAQEDEVTKLADSKQLCFGLLAHDGNVAPHPPVKRAIDQVVEALKKQGHKVVEWKPPPHKEILDITGECWGFDGGADSREAFELSGEPQAKQVIVPNDPQYNASQIMQVLLRKRDFMKSYMEYWNSTEQETGTGRLVDAIICPVAPFTAARPEKYTYYGYTAFVNGLDYTSVVLPVTKADKSVDKPYADFEPVSDDDRITQETYDPEIYDGAEVPVQLVGRKLQEEKMLALADYVSKALRS